MHLNVFINYLSDIKCKFVMIFFIIIIIIISFKKMRNLNDLFET